MPVMIDKSPVLVDNVIITVYKEYDIWQRI